MGKFPSEILRFDSIDSTNTKAKELLQAGIAHEGSVVVAKTQTSGKGSKGREWVSPVGGLYCSIIFTPHDARRITDYSILAGTAVAQALATLLPKSVDISVKWPNDCLISWKKVSGILSESFEHAGKTYVIVGVGINVNMDETILQRFEGSLFKATSLKHECSGTEMDLDKVLDMLLKKIFTLSELYRQDGFTSIQFLWQSNCRLIGKKIELRETGWSEADYQKGKGSMTGVCQGIDHDGSIILANEKGERRNFYTGEIAAFWP